MGALEFIYRWCDDYGGGIVFAPTIEEARSLVIEKLKKDERDRISTLKVWPWLNDDYFDKNHELVLDIYD